MDGTPFGRPMITTRPAPDRPRLSIPPRKRVKTGCDADHSTLVQVGSDDGDESDDESYKESDEEQEVSEVGDDDDDEVVGADMGAEVETYAESDEAEESDEEEEDGIDEADFEELSRDYENPLMDYFDSDEVATSQVASSEQPSQLKAICGARDTQSLQGQNGSLQGDSSEDDDDYADNESSQDNDSSDGGDDSGDAVSSDEESMEADIVRQAGDFFLPDYFYSDATSAAGGAVDSPMLPQIYQSRGISGEVGGDERESGSELLDLSGSSMFTGPEQDEDSRSSSEDPSDSSDSEESGESEKVVVPKDERSSKKAR